MLSLIVSLCGFSQTEKGARLIGGSGYFNLKDNFSFRLSPTYGQFIAEDLAFGGEISVDYYSRHDFNDTGLSLGPFIRYYIGNTSSRLLLLGNLGFGTHTRRDPYDRWSQSAFSAGFGVGFVHFITKQVGLEAVVNYKNNWGADYSFDELYIALGFQIHLAPR